jgi:prophage maintenance system killer protein
MAMVTFLKLTGLEPVASGMTYYETMMALASGALDKQQLADWLRSMVAPSESSE